MEEIREPDWTTWLHVQNVSLWEGVLLSLDIEPQGQPYDHDDLEASTGYGRDKDKWNGVRSRLLVARRNVGEGGRLLEYPYPGLISAAVPLHRFAAWAKTVGWEMPAQLLQLAEQENDSRASTGRWPWGNYETICLRVLAEAVKDWWTTYDPENKGTAPAQNDVQQYVAEKLRDAGYESPDSMARSIAAIIRADDAPKGRRRATRSQE